MSRAAALALRLAEARLEAPLPAPSAWQDAGIVVRRSSEWEQTTFPESVAQADSQRLHIVHMPRPAAGWAFFFRAFVGGGSGGQKRARVDGMPDSFDGVAEIGANDAYIAFYATESCVGAHPAQPNLARTEVLDTYQVFHVSARGTSRLESAVDEATAAGNTTAPLIGVVGRTWSLVNRPLISAAIRRLVLLDERIAEGERAAAAGPTAEGVAALVVARASLVQRTKPYEEAKRAYDAAKKKVADLERAAAEIDAAKKDALERLAPLRKRRAELAGGAPATPLDDLPPRFATYTSEQWIGHFHKFLEDEEGDPEEEITDAETDAEDFYLARYIDRITVETIGSLISNGGLGMLSPYWGLSERDTEWLNETWEIPKTVAEYRDYEERQRRHDDSDDSDDSDDGDDESYGQSATDALIDAAAKRIKARRVARGAPLA